jgi:hypothetical protein
MRTAIETEGHRVGAALVRNSPLGAEAIQFSTSVGNDHQQGRLWTEATNTTHYHALCRAVKRQSIRDKESGLWVKRASQDLFATYRAENKRALQELSERNRRFVAEVQRGTLPED